MHQRSNEATTGSGVLPASTAAAAATSAATLVETAAGAIVDYALVERTLGFHGAPMQKVWEGERGDQDLLRATVAPDFGVYAGRQKGLEFADRAKRLQLHQFLARKADVLFGRQPQQQQRSQIMKLARSKSVEPLAAAAAATVAVPVLPFNSFFDGERADKAAQLQHIYKVSKRGTKSHTRISHHFMTPKRPMPFAFSSSPTPLPHRSIDRLSRVRRAQLLNVGDIVYAEVATRTVVGMLTRLLCSRPPNFHYLANLNARVSELSPLDRDTLVCVRVTDPVSVSLGLSVLRRAAVVRVGGVRWWRRR